mmetsp:Transcript_26715/g.40383  ORF Transcript_26715/g.40383 Transcript_26715/m.40383 type:complete len:537 (-) Transcript_26715:2109-3719(-)
MAIRTLDNIQAQLEKTTGLILSQDWLASCRTHLQHASQETVDAVLCQVLHADLRDVVRPLNQHSAVETASVDLPHLLLRKAVTESLRGEARKAILPSTFRLLVQVEELFDVSLDAESRFSKRNTNLSIQNKTRCLKVYLSDGHIPCFDLIGMEVSPIPNLSVNSTAGAKVLMRGPLEIRLGILQWNPSNAIVLGGCVSELIPIQRKAMEQAQRLAGVDPTVRALIGNDLVGELEQQDEGEAASSDVVNHTRPQQNFALSRVVPQIPQSEPPLERQRQQSHTDRPQTHTLSLFQENKAALSEAPRTNPYARKTGSSTRPAMSINRSKIVNLYEDEDESSSQNTNSHILEKRTEIIPALEASPQRSIALTNPPEPVSFEQLIDLLRQFPSIRCEDKVYVVPAKMKGGHLYFNIDKRTKNKSRSDNKRKSTGGNKDDKYEYVMKIHLSGSGTSQLVTAVVSDLILRPHFQLKPGEMRKLSREDRATSEKLVQKGGESVTAALTVLNAWEVSILKSGTPSQPIDGAEPVLRIIQLSDLRT